MPRGERRGASAEGRVRRGECRQGAECRGGRERGPPNTAVPAFEPRRSLQSQTTPHRRSRHQAAPLPAASSRVLLPRWPLRKLLRMVASCRSVCPKGCDDAREGERAIMIRAMRGDRQGSSRRVLWGPLGPSGVCHAARTSAWSGCSQGVETMMRGKPCVASSTRHEACSCSSAR